jgi:cytochrome c oxidase assembly protein subunit 15
LIIAALLWLGLSIRGVKSYTNKPLFVHVLIALLVFVPTFVWGAFTAGLDAGLIYNDSFPKMGGQWIPPDMWQHSPAWLNFLKTHSGVQFTHRWLAMFSVLAIGSLWAHACVRRAAFPAIHALGVMVIIQFGLGMATLMSGVALPIATAHQGGAVIILMLLIVSVRQLKPA